MKRDSDRDTRSVPPDLDAVIDNAARISGWIRRTPVTHWSAGERDRRFDGVALTLKLELLQLTGSFKLRSALTVVGLLDEARRRLGLVTVSSGNFAIACAYAARVHGTRLTVFMSRHADPFRIERARMLGAEVRLVEDNLAAFHEARALDAAGSLTFVHPWDGPATSLGTASIALELNEDLPADVNTFVVAIGGGSLISGLAPTIKTLRPGARVIGVEPTGAPTLFESVRDGAPSTSLPAGTIADSLAAPFAEPYSFGLVRDHVDDILLVDDQSILEGMRTLFRASRLVVEPAAATALSAIATHPEHFKGGVCAMLCGSNIGIERYLALLGGLPDD